MNVKVKLIPTENGKYADMPKYQSEFSAGADLCACIDAPVTIAPGERALIPTGIAIDMERRDCGAFIFARSGLASKHGICLANGVGVVDSDYRGEIIVALHNHGNTPQIVESGERVAQFVITPVLTPAYEAVQELSDTARNQGGFGSTGK